MCFPGSRSAWHQDVDVVQKGPRPSRKPKDTETIILKKTYTPIKSQKSPTPTTESPKVSKTTLALTQEPASAPQVSSAVVPVVHNQTPVTEANSVPKETGAPKISPKISQKSGPSPPPSPRLEWVYVEEENEPNSKKTNKPRHSRASPGGRKETLSWTMARDASRATLPAAPSVPQYDTYRYVEGRNIRYSSAREG